MKALIVSTTTVRLPTVPRITVPLPPSTWDLYYLKGSQRYKTTEYKRWIRATDHLWLSLEKPDSLPCCFYALTQGQVNEERDGDNLKALTDAAVRAGVIPDDSWKYLWDRFESYRRDDGEPRVTCWFEAIGERT